MSRLGDVRAERAQAIIPSDLGALFTGKDMTPMHSCVSLILPIALFSGLKNLNREDAKGKSREA